MHFRPINRRLTALFITIFVVSFAYTFGFTSAAGAEEVAEYDDYEDPYEQCYTAGPNGAPRECIDDPMTGDTYVYEAKWVGFTDACGGMSLRACHDSRIGTFYYAAQTIYGRSMTVNGLPSAQHGYTAAQLVDRFLTSEEGAPLMSASSFQYSSRLYVNSFGGECYDDYCFSYSQNIDQAMWHTATDLDYGRLTRQKLGENLVVFGVVIGSQRSNFENYVTTLRRGFDLGQRTLIDVIEYIDPCKDNPEYCEYPPYDI